MKLLPPIQDTRPFQYLSSHVLKHRFESGLKNGRIQMPYRLYIPDGYHETDDSEYPIFLTLHGAGRRGNDNRKQIYSSAVFYSSSRIQKTQPSFVLAPQCPKNFSWADVSSWAEGTHSLRNITPALETSVNIFDEIIDRYRINPGRQYISGFSMGGYGTWEAIVRFPNRFEAAVPISGGGIPEKANCLDSVRVWAFHGAKDTTVPVSGTQRMINAMRQSGLSPRYTEFESHGHTARPVFRKDGLVDWLFHKDY